MGLERRFLMGMVLAGSMASASYKVSGALDVNVGEQNRGTVVGRMLAISSLASGYRGFSNIDVRLTNSSQSLSRTSYRVRTTGEGQFLIEVPAGTYDVYGCLANSYGTTSITVTRGSTVNTGDVQLNKQPNACVIADNP